PRQQRDVPFLARLAQKEQQITSSKRHSRKATLGGQGRKRMIPFAADLLYYMRERRSNNKYVRVFHLMQWIRRHKNDWLVAYIAAKKSEEVGFESLRCLLLRFCARNRFTHRKPCVSKLSKVVLDSVWIPRVKLPIMFVVHGKPGGTIDKKEIPSYPPGHWYAVQENAWMEERVWLKYLDELSNYLLDSSVLLVDNLECHVSEKAHDKIESLPPNSTSKCQPLDVGIIGPLKAMLKTSWLLEDDEGNGDDLTLQQKRMAIIKRTILVWDKISTESVKGAFEKSIPSVMQF
ncbi:hypothetical protein B5M09_013556, partial [Aphanomyces astaci]